MLVMFNSVNVSECSMFTFSKCRILTVNVECKVVEMYNVS